MESIRSASHPLVKRVRAVAKKRESGMLLLEGEHLVQEALERGMDLDVVLVSESRADEAQAFLGRGGQVRIVTDSLFASISRMQSPTGVMALAGQPPQRRLADLPADPDSLVVVVAGVQDPGNLGALARTAEAAGAAAMLILPGGCSPWNEKALRGSMGSLLRLQVVEADTALEGWDACSRLDYRHVCARTRGGNDPTRFDWSGRVALWITAETGVLPPELEERLEDAEAVSIPMASGVESLNVTAAAAVLLFATGRAAGGE